MRDRYECRLCLDSGLVSVFHPVTMRAVMRDRHPDYPLQAYSYECARVPARLCNVACECDRGGPWEIAEPKVARALPKYDPSRMVAVAGTRPTVDELAALDAHIDKVATRRPENYDDSFDSWNDEGEA